MSFNLRLWPVASAVLIAVVLLLAPLPAVAQMPDLVITVGDTVAFPGDQGIRIPVYMSNYNDTVAGFDLWIQLDRPDIGMFSVTTTIEVDTNYWFCNFWYGDSCGDSIMTDDTTYWKCVDWIEPGYDCADSVRVPPDSVWDFMHVGVWDWYTIDTTEVLSGVIDTVGTMIGGWEFVNARSLSGYGTDLHIAAIADLAMPPHTPGIPPPQQNGVLFYLLFDAFDIPDSMSDRTVNFYPSSTCFSDNHGECIGYTYEQVADSSCYICVNWIPDFCLEWQKVAWVPGGVGCDSIGVDYDSVAILDTAQVRFIDGSLTLINNGIWGDIDGNGSMMDIADLVYLVSYMFAGGPPPDQPWTADCDQDGDIDIADLICWITWIFKP